MSLKKFIADSKMFEYDKHYRDCTQSNHPFIKAKINPANGYYHIEIDLMPCRYVFSEEGMILLEKLFQKETEHLSKTSSKGSFHANFSVNKELSWVDGVIPSRLNSFCEELYDLSQKYHV